MKMIRVCAICGTEIMQQIRMGRYEPAYWIHLREWWQDKDHQPELTWMVIEPAPTASEYAWW